MQIRIHADKVQSQKEAEALLALRNMQPDIFPPVWHLALEECDWDANNANLLLEEFKRDNREKLDEMTNAVLEIERAQRRRDVTNDGAVSDSASDSASDSSKKRSRRHHKKSKKRKKADDDVDRKKKHKKKRSRRDSKSSKRHRSHSPSSGDEAPKTGFGAYGIIGEKDKANKFTEFALWSSETKNIDVETLSRFDEADLYKTFCEDYNTVTLPHVKYYNVHEYEAKQRRLEESGMKPKEDSHVTKNDEENLRREILAARDAEKKERLRDAYLDLKHFAPHKAQDMRRQNELRSQMAQAYRLGDRELAAQIADRLKPDQQRERDLKKRAELDPGLEVDE